MVLFIYFYYQLSLYLGFFKGLRQEFYLTNTPVSITIIPLPYVHTETVQLF